MDTAVTGIPRTLLRCEGLVLLIAAIAGYRALGGSWMLFGAFLLAPDLSLVAYAAGPRAGAIAYNAAHTYMAAAALAACAFAGVLASGWLLSLIWMAHIGMDRALGYGLKFGHSFHLSHLGAIGRGAHGARGA